MDVSNAAPIPLETTRLQATAEASDLACWVKVPPGGPGCIMRSSDSGPSEDESGLWGPAVSPHDPTSVPKKHTATASTRTDLTVPDRESKAKSLTVVGAVGQSFFSPTDKRRRLVVTEIVQGIAILAIVSRGVPYCCSLR